MFDSNIKEPIQSKAEVLKNSSSIPQNYVVQDGAVNLYHAGNVTGDVIPGAMVFNQLKPGSVGHTATLSVLDNDGNKRQRIVTNLKSNHDVERRRVFDFEAADNKLNGSREGQLLMKIYHDENGDTLVDAFQKNGDLGVGVPTLIPLLVGPSSISLAPALTEEEVKQLGYDELIGIDWGGIAKGVLSALPTIAQTGLEIYKEVSKNATDEEKAAPDGIIGLLGAVASIAVPFVSSLL